MKKTPVFIAYFLLAIITFGQNVTQHQTISNLQQINISKPIVNTQIDFEQLSQDLENLATKTPDGKIRCFTEEYNQMLRLKYPGIQNTVDFEAWIAPKIEEYNNNLMNGSVQKVVVTIPVIMHIIHNSTEGVGTGRNISQAQATSQITILNEDFRKLNADTALIPAAFKPLAADLEINFVPALRYASNHALAGQTLVEPGIERISAPTIPGVANTTTGYSMAFIDATIKPNTYWDRTEVMNIWVCQISGGILGYAQFPSGSGLPGLGGATGANTDGVVLRYTVTGTGGVTAAPYNKGRTATHEIGHWFGLRHIWADETACAADDYVTDTPQQKDKNYGCPSYPQTTGAGGRCSAGDPSSMFMNYMDYTNDACQFMFTQGQKGRVVTVLANSPGRVELPTSTLGSPLVTTAQFIGTPTTINVGGVVNFTDQSISPNTLTTWNWTFPGGTPSSYTGQTPPAISYAAAGQYNVTLTVTDNLSGTDIESKTNYINVIVAGACDTLTNIAATDTLRIYNDGAGGYVAGWNQWSVSSHAEQYSNYSPYTYVTGTEIYLYGIVDGGSGATVDFNVWNDASGVPGTIIESVTYSLTDIANALSGSPKQGILQIFFDNPVNVGIDPFYIGVNYNGFTASDKLGIVSNSIYDPTPNTAFQNNGGWEDMSSSFGFPFSLYISPYMSLDVPTANITTNTATICAGGSVNFDASTSTNTVGYNWVFNGGSPTSSTSATQAVSYAATGTPRAYLIADGNCGSFAVDSVDITVNPATVPTFTAVTPKCAGSAIAALPTTSNNGVTGTWAPAINNTTTTTYTFTPTAGQCATTTTLTITVNPNVTPTFTAITPKCAGSAIAALPTTSNNGITGTWSPAINNTTTTTYTFTPTAGQCATTTTLTITVNPNVTPTFTAVTPKCAGSAIAALPTTSNNGVTGTWAPALNNMFTTTYTFTPTAGQCATATTLTITVIPNTAPTFTAVPAICSGDALSALPTTSNNGVTGTWSPALNNMVTTTYTFTPTAGQCATATVLTITVNASDNATISYPQVTYCISDNDATPTITGLTGGTFSSSPAGLTIDGSTGIIGVSSSTGGTYTVSYTTNGSCPIISNAIVVIDLCTGVEEVVKGKIKVYPNPTSSILTIETINISVAKISLMNLLGDKITEQNSYGSEKTTVNVNEFACGIYLLQLYNADGEVIHAQKVSIK